MHFGQILNTAKSFTLSNKQIKQKHYKNQHYIHTKNKSGRYTIQKRITYICHLQTESNINLGFLVIFYLQFEYQIESLVSSLPCSRSIAQLFNLWAVVIVNIWQTHSLLMLKISSMPTRRLRNTESLIRSITIIINFHIKL